MTRRRGSSDPTETWVRVSARRLRVAATCAVVGLLACGALGVSSRAQPPPPRGETAKGKGSERAGETPGAADDARPVKGFTHPGLLHSPADFERMRSRVARGEQPWTAGWQKLLANRHASLAWKPNPKEIVYRGADGKHPENYPALYHDAAAAYALALRWQVSRDDAYARKAIEVLNAWAATLTAIRGTSDRYLASGIYG